MGDWRWRAACAGTPLELWYPMPVDKPAREAAVAICARCPVTRECRQFADDLRLTSGIWAGQDRELEALVRSHRRRPDLVSAYAHEPAPARPLDGPPP